jgi:hypothetical protein
VATCQEVTVGKLAAVLLASVVLAVSIGLASSASGAGRADCLYPSLTVSLSGGSMIAQQGRFYSYPCPVGKARHRLVVLRERRNRVLLKMVPIG